MPCNDGGRPVLDDKNGLWHRSSILCGIATVLEQQNCLINVLDTVDWEEVGVPRQEFEDWWAAHKVHDTVRKQREARERRLQQVRKEAAAKLTPEEWTALGLR